MIRDPMRKPTLGDKIYKVGKVIAALELIALVISIGSIFYLKSFWAFLIVGALSLASAIIFTILDVTVE